MTPDDFASVCPIPLSDYPRVLLAHGGGGRLMQRLIDRMFVETFSGAEPADRHDGAILDLDGGRPAFTTDSYVVKPLFFPGGDIGSLAVNGTVNDLAMCGAKPRYLGVGFILEEGLPMGTLWRIVRSMRQAADAAGVRIVTGDTKVVDQGKGDGVFINTSGVGVVRAGVSVSPRNVRQGDAVILSGDIGRHGIAIMAAREGLEFETEIASDCAPLAEPVARLLDAGVAVRCLRDLTRGGMASAVIEIAEAASVHIRLREDAISVREDVRGACEILGFDPLYVANEGRFVAFVPQDAAERAVEVLRADPVCRDAHQVGSVVAGRSGEVTMTTRLGTSRAVDMLSGEQLPRIC